MPVMDGVEAAQTIRKLGDEYAKLPIIALTANAMAGDEERYLGLGMNDYVPKPIDPDRLTLALRRSIATDAAPIRGADLRAAPEQAPETIEEGEGRSGEGLPRCAGQCEAAPRGALPPRRRRDLPGAGRGSP
jgi:DNA-binding response OmpR family regulator